MIEYYWLLYMIDYYWPEPLKMEHSNIRYDSYWPRTLTNSYRYQNRLNRLTYLYYHIGTLRNPYNFISFRHCDLNSSDRLLTARNPIRTGVGCSNRTYRNRQPYLIGQTPPTNIGSFHLRYGDTSFYRRLTTIHRCQWSIARGEGPLSKFLLWSRPQRW